MFVDGSVNTIRNIGYGAYLSVSERELSMDSLKSRVQVKRFEDTSSTKLELQTLLWALTEVCETNEKLVVYTDSQNIIGLPGRRSDLERTGYRSGKNKLLNNHELYRQFYDITDVLDLHLMKVQGHQPSGQRDVIGQLFSLVDRASRRALRAACV